MVKLAQLPFTHRNLSYNKLIYGGTDAVGSIDHQIPDRRIVGNGTRVPVQLARFIGRQSIGIRQAHQYGMVGTTIGIDGSRRQGSGLVQVSIGTSRQPGFGDPAAAPQAILLGSGDCSSPGDQDWLLVCVAALKAATHISGGAVQERSATWQEGAVLTMADGAKVLLDSVNRWSHPGQGKFRNDKRRWTDQLPGAREWQLRFTTP